MPPVGGGGGVGAGAAGAGAASACGRDAVGRGLARCAGSGDGAITLISGSTVWAVAPGGAIDNPRTIAGAATDARRPQWQVLRFLTTPPKSSPLERVPV